MIEPCLCGDPECPRCFSQPCEDVDDIPYTDPRDTFFREKDSDEDESL